MICGAGHDDLRAASPLAIRNLRSDCDPRWRPLLTLAFETIGATPARRNAAPLSQELRLPQAQSTEWWVDGRDVEAKESP